MAKVKPAARRGARKASARGASKRKASRRKTSTRKRSTRKTSTRKASGTPGTPSALSLWSEPAVEDQFTSSSFSLHDLFQQQTRQMLDRSDLDEEQKQNILVAMNCPCCGAGAMSYTAKLRRR
jgi:hypothetical protein